MIGNIFCCLRDFLLSEPNDLLSNKDIASKVFQAIEYGILGDLVLPKALPLKPDPTGISFYCFISKIFISSTTTT